MNMTESSNKHTRYPVLKHCLDLCKFNTPSAFQTIIDIGVRYGTPFLMDVFPNAHHFLFEPVRSCHERIRSAYSEKSISFTLAPIGLGGETGRLYLHELSSDQSGKITHSDVSSSPIPNNSNCINVVDIQVSTLDDYDFGPLHELSYCIKLDVDGIEEDIIEGGRDTIRGASFVILEASVQRGNLLRRLQLMDGLGFRVFDICDNAYYRGQLSCLDLVFVNENLRGRTLAYRPWEQTKGVVQWADWQQGYPELETQPFDASRWQVEPSSCRS